MIDTIKVVRKKNRKKFVGSLKINMPIIIVKNAPIPVQTAYAVPSGICCIAFDNK